MKAGGSQLGAGIDGRSETGSKIKPAWPVLADSDSNPAKLQNATPSQAADLLKVNQIKGQRKPASSQTHGKRKADKLKERVKRASQK